MRQLGRVPLEAGRRYDLPATFGPSLLPDVTRIESVRTISIPFVTKPAALSELLPPWFGPADVATVTVSHLMYDGVDYIAGRGYNVLAVSLAARFPGREVPIDAPYAVVMWENLTAPIVAGREFLGHAKIFGEVGDVVEQAETMAFTCAEFGTPLVQGEVASLRPLSATSLGRLNERSATAKVFGWKYIPGRHAPDVDYPTLVENPVVYRDGWTAVGEVVFCDVSWEEAPISSRIVAAIRRLPVVSYGRAFVGVGSAMVPRVTVERLEAPG
ncbi:MAG: acetoacetate decarboxylase family protein [Acidimicrobiia bacterium]